MGMEEDRMRAAHAMRAEPPKIHPVQENPSLHSMVAAADMSLFDLPVTCRKRDGPPGFVQKFVL
jgi:hypothetical protein